MSPNYSRIQSFRSSWKRNSILIGLALTVVLLGGKGTVKAVEQPMVVLIAPFENLSGARAMITYEAATGSDPNEPKRKFEVDRYSEAPRAILEDMILKFNGVKIVERQRLDSILLEAEFGCLSGLVDTEKAVKLGKMLGAKTIIMGTILDVHAKEKAFSGYGIATKSTQVSCELRVRLLDMTSGAVAFSKIVRGSESFMASSFGGTKDSNVAYSVIEAALEQLRDDDEFKNAVERGGGAGTKPEPVSPVTGSVEIEFAPKPANCDIEIDGNYVGGSPLIETRIIG